MSSIDIDKELPKGILSKVWSTTVSDYIIAGGWLHSGDLIVVGDAAGGVFGIDGKSGDIIWEQCSIHKEGLLDLSIHPHKSLVATVGKDSQVYIWSTIDGTLQQTITVAKGWAENISWSKDGQWLALSIARYVYVYDANGEQIWQSSEHPSTVSAIAWSGTQELATACYGQVTFFSAINGNIIQKLEWKGSLVSMVLSPDADIVACGSQDNSVHFWRRSTEQDSMMSGYQCKPTALAFDSSGDLLATSGGDTAIVWNFTGEGPEGTKPGMLELHVQPITALSFTSSGRVLASGGRDGAVVVWSIQSDGSGNVLGADIVDASISELAWQPNNNSLASFDSEGRITLWHINSNK